MIGKASSDDRCGHGRGMTLQEISEAQSPWCCVWLGCVEGVCATVSRVEVLRLSLEKIYSRSLGVSTDELSLFRVKCWSDVQVDVSSVPSGLLNWRVPRLVFPTHMSFVTCYSYIQRVQKNGYTL